MPYDNIAIFALPANAIAPMAVIRQGSNNDWAAYMANGLGEIQSGSLTRLYKGECDNYGITAAISAVYPHLTFRY